MVHGPDAELESDEPEALDADMKAFNARVRAEIRTLVQALAKQDYYEAAALVRPVVPTWTPSKMEAAMTPFHDEHDELVFDHRARLAHNTTLTRTGPGRYSVVQILHDPERHNEWSLEGEIDLSAMTEQEDRLIALTRVVGPGVFD